MGGFARFVDTFFGGDLEFPALAAVPGFEALAAVPAAPPREPSLIGFLTDGAPDFVVVGFLLGADAGRGVGFDGGIIVWPIQTFIGSPKSFLCFFG